MVELSHLASDQGVPTMDALESALFPLRAHLITCFGDIPVYSISNKGNKGL
ncbi:hypothetical protein K435DRAFT_879100 [Dendrothele bispora CBS 962.96]|uniref:Uncharacterized protein n=1 Tax=Dendrothele bispora (strain CBS 962.96) TaxID=1314807 RepID=A0A4S8KLW3_DENBC|nr:hypothetical protein K435DRAFT_879100 [Dendrothele bispora CBS 962.96]